MIEIKDLPNNAIIKNDTIIVYKDLSYINIKRGRTAAQINAESNLKFKEPSGVVTTRIKNKIQSIVNNWIAAINHHKQFDGNSMKLYPGLITLTLPSKQTHTDKELNAKGLNKFLIYLKRNFNVVNYLWRAERQKNGNLHYHIVIDKYVHHSKIKELWNNILNSLGYIEAYRINQVDKHSDGFKVDVSLLENWSYEKQLKAYNYGIESNWNDPNTTDIHSLKNVKDVAKYLSKYISKDENYSSLKNLQNLKNKQLISDDEFDIENEKIRALINENKVNSRLWGCSDSLRNIKDLSLQINNEVDKFIRNVCTLDNSKIISHDNVTVICNNNLKALISSSQYMCRKVFYHNKMNYYLIYVHPYEPLSETDLVNNDGILQSRQYIPEQTIFSQLNLF